MRVWTCIGAMNIIVDLQLEGVTHWIGCQFAHAMSAKFKAFSFLTIYSVVVLSGGGHQHLLAHQCSQCEKNCMHMKCEVKHNGDMQLLP